MAKTRSGGSKRGFVARKPKPPKSLLAIILGVPSVLIVVFIVLIAIKVGTANREPPPPDRDDQKAYTALKARLAKVEKEFMEMSGLREKDPEEYQKRIEPIYAEFSSIMEELSKLLEDPVYLDENGNLKEEYQGIEVMRGAIQNYLGLIMKTRNF